MGMWDCNYVSVILVTYLTFLTLFLNLKITNASTRTPQNNSEECVGFYLANIYQNSYHLSHKLTLMMTAAIDVVLSILLELIYNIFVYYS